MHKPLSITKYDNGVRPSWFGAVSLTNAVMGINYSQLQLLFQLLCSG